LKNLAKRDFQVLLYVIAKSLERRDVKDFRSIEQLAMERLTNQAINTGKKRGKSLARTSRRRD